jgi:hypothetical protein
MDCVPELRLRFAGMGLCGLGRLGIDASLNEQERHPTIERVTAGD